MSCRQCTGVFQSSCEETYCNGSVSLPCEFVISASCVKNLPDLPNLRACTESGSLVCSDLQSVLQKFDDALVCEGGGDGFWSQNSVDGYLYPTTLTDNVGIGTNAPIYKMEVYGDFATISEPQTGHSSYAVNGEYTVNLPYSSPTSLEGILLGYETSSTTALLAILPGTVSSTFEESGYLNSVTTNGSGANVQHTESPTVYTQITALSNNTAIINSQTATDNTSLIISPTSLSIDGSTAFSGTFTTGTGDTVTVVKGIIISVAP